MQTYYLTRHIGQLGIQKVEGSICEKDERILFIGDGYSNFVLKPLWHTTYEAARGAAEAWRRKQLQDCLHRIRKLEALKF